MEDTTKNNILLFISELRNKIFNLTLSDGSSFIKSPNRPEKPELFSLSRLEEIASSTLSILSNLYGDKHQHLKDFVEKVAYYRRHTIDPHQKLLNCCLGKLNAIETDIKFGLLQTIEKEISGEVLAISLKPPNLPLTKDTRKLQQSWGVLH